MLQKIFIGIELLIFQDNLNFFYFNRFIIVCIFFIILFIYSSKLIGQYLSLILLLIFISSRSTGDILTRIFTGEIITLAVLIFLIPITFKIISAYKNYNFSKELSKLDLFIYFISFNLLILSKENTLVFLIFPIIFIYLYLKNKIDGKFFFIINILNIFLGICYFFYIYFVVEANIDLYSTGVLKGLLNPDFYNISRLIYKFIKYIFLNYFIHIFILSYVYFYLRKDIDLIKHFIILLISSLIIFSQFLIYDANLPSNMRYDNIIELLFYFNSLYLILFLKHKNIFF